MVKVVEREQKQIRLVLKKNWQVWKKLAGIWKRKKIPDPLKWQRKIREERPLP